MSVFLTCSCGRQHKVKAELAGKKIRCKQCGDTMRVPEARGVAAAPEVAVDIFSLVEQPEPRVADSSTEEGPAASGPRSRGEARKRSKSRPPRMVGRLLDILPRGPDLALPIAGAVGFVIAMVALALGGLLAQSVFVFLAIAAPICLFWAGISALITAMRQGFDRAVPLFIALAST